MLPMPLSSSYNFEEPAICSQGGIYGVATWQECGNDKLVMMMMMIEIIIMITIVRMFATDNYNVDSSSSMP